MDFIRKSKEIFSPGNGVSKIPILYVCGNFVFFLLLGFYELNPAAAPVGSIFEGVPYYLPFLSLGFFSALCFLLQERRMEGIRDERERQKETLDKTVTLLEEVTAFYQSSSVISARKDEALLPDLIARESLKCLRAHRAVLFFQERERSEPRIGSVFAVDPVHETGNLEIEKEGARRTLSQKRPLLLREPREFADLFPKGGKNGAVSSLLCVPLVWLGKALGAISVSLMTGERKFNEKDLECLTLFSHHAAAAIRSSRDEGGANLNRDFDRGMEEVASGLRRLPPEKQNEILRQFQELLREGEADGIKESARTSSGGEDKIMHVTPGDDAFEFSDELGDGGLFIRTPDPLELGERFLLRLHDGNGGEPIEVACKVIWTNQYGKESKHLLRGMGVKFLDLRMEDRKKLQDYLHASRRTAEASA